MARVVVYEGSQVLFEETGLTPGDANRRKQALQSQYPRSRGYDVQAYG
jgi:hypothetical protein